ncbi:ribulose-phosphate 3-epimerase [Patescibacteria group bacterium]|nr:ribulose-phosphate 3-epimerase [Patescibacteria group bacterium]
MTEIIPAVIAQNFNELEEKIKKVEPDVDWVQLDIMDGRFVNESTWPYAEPGKNNPAELKNLKTKVNLEAHLMIAQPIETVEDWIDSGVKRIIFHYEATDQPEEVIEKIKKSNLEVGLAINPATPIEVLDEYLADLDLILIMTVEPGRGGQELLPETLAKIKKLRQSYPNLKIEADGGVNLKTALEVIRAGANILAVGSVIFNSKNIKETINQMKLCP